MSDMASALAVALAGPRPPATTWGQVEALGGRRRGVRAMALLQSGRDPDGELPAAGSVEYRRYRDARRRVERWLEYERPTGKQARRPNQEILNAQRNEIRAASTRRRVAALRRRGARSRIFVEVQVSDDIRLRWLPSGGPGLFLPAADVRAFTDPFLRGDFARAGTVFERVFFRRYEHGDDTSFQIIDVHVVKVWPDGTSEP